MRNWQVYCGSLRQHSHTYAMSYMMNGAVALVLGLLFLSGCWTGGPLPANEIAYKHDAVLWAYKTGGQIGRYGIVFAPVQNDLLDLQPGVGCVLVREGQTGGQCSAAPQADIQLKHALDLRTGHPVSAHTPTKSAEYPKPILRGNPGNWEWEMRVDDTLSVYIPGETGRLYMRVPADVLILRVKYPDPHVKYEPWLGVPIAAFRTADHTLVLGLSQGYVICVDLTKLPVPSRSQTQTSPAVPKKQANESVRP